MRMSINKRLMAGVGLIEVMMALLVLSVGFLASANMQLRGIRANQGSHHQSQALMLANEIMDRMRNNRPGVLEGKYNGMSTNAPVAMPACASSGCGGADLAKLDHFEWSANLRDLRGESTFVPVLPALEDGTPAFGLISAPDADGVFSVTITWLAADTDDGAPASLALRFVP